MCAQDLSSINMAGSPEKILVRGLNWLGDAGMSTPALLRLRAQVDGLVLRQGTFTLPLAPDDVLFVPTSASRSAAVRGLEAALEMGTGVVIWHR